MSKINISGQVPAEQNNGLVELESVLLAERTPEPIVAVVVIDRHGLKFVDDKQEWSSTVKLKHIEPLSGDAAETGRKLLESAFQVRTGETTLDVFATQDDAPDFDPDDDDPVADDFGGNE
jgi:hypothetical protein